jgi:hypothetical protein
MIVPFNKLPGNSKVWIYQASHFMNQAEKEIISSNLQLFLESWTAHEASLKAGFEILYDLFVVIAVDESFNNASGCSIDKMVNFMKSAGEKTGIDFFNRMRVAWLQGEKVEHMNLHEFTAAISQGKIDNNVVVFNNLVTDVNEFNASWKQLLQESWVNSMLIN